MEGVDLGGVGTSGGGGAVVGFEPREERCLSPSGLPGGMNSRDLGASGEDGAVVGFKEGH